MMEEEELDELCVVGDCSAMVIFNLWLVGKVKQAA